MSHRARLTVVALALTLAFGALQATAAEAQIQRLDPALDAVIAPGTKIERVASGFKFTEGPMWRAGRLWFSDLVDDKMLAVTPAGKVEVLLTNSGGVKNPPTNSYLGSNAMAPDKDGSVLMIQQGGRRIVRLDSQLHIHPFLDRYQGKKLNSPNDLVFAPDGSLWFTDPPFGLTGMDQDPAKELSFNGVFRYSAGTLTAALTDLTLPNGIGFSPDGKTLYVSNYGPKRYVKAFEAAPDGKLSNPHMQIEYSDDTPGKEGPAGLKIDTAGNIWPTGPGGLRNNTPQGKVQGQIKLPEVAANLAFADEGKTAYITASTSIYRLQLKTPGVMPLYSQR